MVKATKVKLVQRDCKANILDRQVVNNKLGNPIKKHRNIKVNMSILILEAITLDRINS